MIVMAASMLPVVGRNLCTAYKIFAIAMPIIIPITATIKKSPVVFQKRNWPVSIAATDTQKMISDDASFIKLSPSKIVTIRFGMPRFCNTDVAAIASGGEIIPPNKKPNASEKSGIIECAVKATAAEVKITRPNASIKMGLLYCQKSFHDVFHAAAYNLSLIHI